MSQVDLSVSTADLQKGKDKQMRNQTILTLISMLFVASCGYDPCVGGPSQVNGNTVTCGNADETGFSDTCPPVVFANGVMSTNFGSCSTKLDRIKDITGMVPDYLDATEWGCTLPPENEQWDCFSEINLLADVYTVPARCGFCSELSNAPSPAAAPRLCWAHASDWAAGQQQGVLTQLFSCDDVTPLIGTTEPPNLEMTCDAGISCLGLDERCSCRCRDMNYAFDIGSGSWMDYIISWWEPTPQPGVPAEVEGVGIPVEATCSGAPLAYRTFDQLWLGTTIELDGPENPFPPDNEYKHKPLWDMLSLDEEGPHFEVTMDFIDAAAMTPNELLWGAWGHSIIDANGHVTYKLDSCDAGSICAYFGFRSGDLLTDLEFSGDPIDVTLIRDGRSKVFSFSVID